LALKEDLVRAVAEKVGAHLVDIRYVMDATFDVIKEILSEEGILSISKFGKFEIKVRDPKIGRNPKTNEEVKIPARNYVKFTPSDNWKKEII
jgi:nucleoid DNA-binding protein